MAITIDGKGVYYADLNERIRQAVSNGHREICLEHITGQRYIACGLQDDDLKITIRGVPGEDLAAFMSGPTVEVMGNAQNTVGNTMNDGTVIVHGLAGDVIGYGMRGGNIFIRDDVGYRVGIHMKGYNEHQPTVVIGGCAGDFFGEYQAGGCLVLLGLTHGAHGRPIVGDYCATGMHGGVMYIRGGLDRDHLADSAATYDLDDADVQRLDPMLRRFAELFQIDEDVLDFHRYQKVTPISTRPYGQVYAY